MLSLLALASAVIVPTGLISLAVWIRHRPKPSPLSGDLAEWDREMREHLDAAAQERLDASEQEGLEQVASPELERMIRDLPGDAAHDAVSLDELLRRGDEA